MKPGAGVTITGDGTISATGGVSTFNARTGGVTLTLSDVTGVTGTGLAAQTNLGLGGAALLSVGTTVGTVAAGNDTRIVGALQSSAIPAASGQLLGGSGSAGAASAVAIGSGLSLSSGVLSLNYTLPTASATTLGGVKVDGSTITVTNGVISASAGGGTIAGVIAGTGLTGGGATGTVKLDVSFGNATPAMDGIGAGGISNAAARSDHVHPADTSRLAAANNLSDLASAPAARANLGLGTAATLASNAVVQGVNNLSDLASATIARTNLGLTSIATLAGGARGEVVYYGASGWARLAAGTAGQLLQSGGTGADPAWATIAGGSSGLGTPQVITTGGAATLDLTKQLAIFNSASAITATLPNGTTDGQEFQVSILPNGGAHSIAGTIYEASTTLPNLSSPNGGVSLFFKWSASRTSWFPRNYDAGLKLGDLAAASSLAGADLVGVSQSGTDARATLAQLVSFVAANGGGAGGGGSAVTTSSITVAGGSTTLTSAQYGASLLLLAGTLTSNATLVVPDTGRWFVKNSCTGNYTVTFKTAAGSGVLVAPYGVTTDILADGANCVAIATPFVSRPPLASLSWRNQGGATATEFAGGPIVVRAPSVGNTNNIRALVAAAPAAPYTFTITGQMLCFSQDYMVTSLFMRNSGSGAIASLSASRNANQEYLEVSHTSSYAAPTPSLSYVKNIFHNLARFRLRVVNDGSNLTYLLSRNGYSWLQFYSETSSAAGSPDEIGVSVNNIDTAGSGVDIVSSITGWELLAGASPQAQSVLAGV